ncbi:MAG: hypothetical protein AB7G13_11620 [Lautropia sp.]
MDRIDVDAYPLSWPIGRKRTERWNRETARFDVTFARARDNVVAEVARLTSIRREYVDVILSTNIALRRDGLPLAGQRQPEDVGVAVYFKYNGRQRCFACDRWTKIEHNMQAIAKTIEALRGVARWGTGDMLAAAFTGFTALPAPTDWRTVLGRPTSLDEARAAYRRLAAEHHPDRGGDAAMMAKVNSAWEAAQNELR